MPGDDKDVAAEFRKVNRKERKDHESGQLTLSPPVQKQLDGIRAKWTALSSLPEKTPAEVDEKKTRFTEFAKSREAFVLSQIASIPIAQFYIPKTEDERRKLITDERFRRFWNEGQAPQGEATALAWSTADSKRFFNWFLEFPEIIQRGGFDCILGNPPYMGGQGLSGTYSPSFCEFVKWEFAPTGLSDLVVFFVRRIYNLLRPNGFTAFITTNSIKDGDVRKDGLEHVLSQGGTINMAVRGVKWPGRANLVVSLVALHKGTWRGKRLLDGKDAPYISAFFEDGVDGGDPHDLPGNRNRVYQGSIFLGDGFLLSHGEAASLISADPSNQDVLFPTINGQEVNNDPKQNPGRSVINFFNWSLQKAEGYVLPFEILRREVKPFRATQNRARNRDVWWVYAEHRPGLMRAIEPIDSCFVAAATTKYLNFSAMPTSYVFTHALYIFTTDRWDLFSVVQTTIHEVWARKYSGALETRLRYSPSDCFQTFPFPDGIWQQANPSLAQIGEAYHEFRRTLMRQLWLGLTDVYNLFHTRDLTPERVAKVSKKPLAEAQAGFAGILELRRLHVELDTAVRDAYGWDVPLEHDFYEVETLPENDRVRYTISPSARKEILKLLLAENHRRAAAEAGVTATARSAKPAPPIEMDANLFSSMAYPSSASDQAICAAALSIVEQSGSISSQEHLDALLLCTRPDWCITFLNSIDQQALKNLLSNAPPGLVVSPGQSVRWNECRTYLEQLGGIEVDRTVPAQPIKTSSTTATAKAALPSGADAVVRYALKSLDRIRELRAAITPPNLSDAERMVLQAFEAQHQEYQLVS